MLVTMFVAFAAIAEPVGVTAPEKTPCAKPGLINRPNITALELNGIMERAQAYVTCMSSAIEAQRELANETLERAKAEAEKSNGMITEVNAFIAEIKAYQSEHTGN